MSAPRPARHTPQRPHPIAKLALAVAGRLRPFDHKADVALGEQCHEATKALTLEDYVALHRGYPPDQMYILEAQWNLVAEFGSLWRAGRL